MTNIAEFSPRTGRMIREDGSIVNEADLMASTALEVARGNLTGATPMSSYGELTTAGAVTDHLVWPLAGTGALVIPAAPGVQLTISSSSANDAAAGTGIRTLDLIYLDGDLIQQTETIALNGVSGVTTVATDIRFVQCMHIATAGSGKAAAGNISAIHSGTTYSYIPTSHRRCLSSAQRVLAGKRLIITSMFASSISGSAAARAQVTMVTTALGSRDFTESAVTIPHVAVGFQDGSEAMSGLSFAIPAGVVVAFEATTDKAATISAGFTGWVEDA